MRKHYNWKVGRSELHLGARTLVMGILNVTPDSFSDGGMYIDRDAAVRRGVEIEAEGADILDVGGESTRPGSTPIGEDEELRRIIPVIEALARVIQIPISVDTYRSAVAERALQAGARIVNDISGLRFDSRLAEVGARNGCGMVLMHSRGSREELHQQPPMMDPTGEVLSGLEESVAEARRAGIQQSAIVLDPGIGFGKRAEESLEVLRNMEMFTRLEYPLLVGTSRKSFLGRLGHEGPEARLWGTAASVAACVLRGAHIVRVHDVSRMRILVDVLDALA